MAKVLRLVSRKRPLEAPINHGKVSEAELDKCLTTLDLISLGVGSCCGAGMYLTSGIIAAKKAGPGGVFSLILAGLASVLTGFHYAELAGICPHTSGSAYMYAYVTVGELAAFVIGWGLIVEYVIGTAAAAVALSETFHSITNKVISSFINSGLDRAGLPHVDFVAAIVCLLLMWLLASGVQMSARVNNILNGFNFLAWIIFICAAYSLGSVTNWNEHGGFLPFGYSGVFSAIPTAYYAFVGFDGLATTGAECKNPVKSIPISIITSIIINIVVFANVVLGLTFNVPYSLLPPDTAMLDMFAMIGYPALKYVMAFGAVAGLFAATFGSLFPLPRVLQAMSQDGLFFRYFAHVCPKRHTALRATVMSGLVATFLAAFVQLTLLIELVLIGTLLAYVIVTYVTLELRLVDIDHVTPSTSSRSSESEDPTDKLTVTTSRIVKRKTSDTDLKHQDEQSITTDRISRQSSVSNSRENGGAINPGFEDDERNIYPRKNSFTTSNTSNNYDQSKTTRVEMTQYCETSYLFTQSGSVGDNSSDTSSPSKRKIFMTKLSSTTFTDVILYLKGHVSAFLLIFYGCLSVMCAILAKLFDQIMARNYIVIVCLSVTTIAVTCMAVLLMFLPHIKRTTEGFRAPLVPLLTVLTASVNIYLMTSLSWVTWLLFLAWLFLGLSIYIFYGTKCSNLNTDRIDGSPDQDIAETELLGNQERDS